MSLKLQIIHATEFIKFTRQGEVDLAATKQGLAAIAKAAEGRSEDSQILIDGRESVWRHSTYDIWTLAEELEKYDVLADKRIAMLVSGTGEKPEFFKQYARDRGYHVNVFRDYEEAINWLFLETDLSH